MVVDGKEESTGGESDRSREAATLLHWHSPGRMPYVCVRYVFMALLLILAYHIEIFKAN